MDVKLAQQELRSEIGAVVARVMASGVYILGPELDAFEKEFAVFNGTEHCVGVGSGFDGLCLILRAMDIGAGDEVIVPAHCFVSLWFAVTSVGATPIPVEPNPNTYNMDPAAMERAITSKTKAVIVLHLYGQPAEMKTLVPIAHGRGLKVIEDVSQAHGARWGDRRVGGWGDAASFCFFPPLNLGATGDGGAVLSNDKNLTERVKSLRSYGSLGKNFGREWGMNSRLGEIQASVLRVKLHKLDEWNMLRRRQADLYRKILTGAPGVTLPGLSEGAEHVWHRFVIRHAQRDSLAKALQVAGVQTFVHYPMPPHFSQAYSHAGFNRGQFPITETLCREVLSLPIGPHLSMAQIQQAATLVVREASALVGGDSAPAPQSISSLDTPDDNASASPW
jgi:dTDP-3-amino-3,4,6-trideoxy-alpha-D-glucose transaminase